LSFEARKLRGTVCFHTRNYKDALTFFDLALEIEPENAQMRFKKAKTLSRLSRHFEAYEVARTISDRREKCMRLLGDCAYATSQWALAAEHYRALAEILGSDAELRRAERRALEAQTGQYDMAAIVSAALTGSRESLDVADYFGPFEVADLPGKGKGMIATVDIQPGTLILAERAFAIGYEGDDRSAHTNFLTAVVHAIQRKPHKTAEFYRLYAGPNYDRDAEMPAGIVDVNHINTIIGMNSFSWGDNALLSVRTDYAALEHGEGIALKASYANHSCMHNALPMMFGDMIFFVCRRTIHQGEEITITYSATWDDYSSLAAEARRSMAHWFERCDCPLCEAMAHRPSAVRAREIMADVETPAASYQELSARTRLWHELHQIYLDYPAKPFLDQFALDLANGFFESGHNKQADEFYQFALAGIGRAGARLMAGFGATRVALQKGQRKRAARMLAMTCGIASRLGRFDAAAFVIAYSPIIQEYCALDDEALDALVEAAIDIWTNEFQNGPRL
jgi:hypothetical protein